MGGSPTGFGMMWLPLALLGVDAAVAERRMAGGWIAAVAMLFAKLRPDTHMFFFRRLDPAVLVCRGVHPAGGIRLEVAG